jgi:hypothetical protein
MSKSWTIIEKIAGVLLMLWGILALYSVTTTVANFSSYGYAASQHITYGQLFFSNHLNFLLALASLFGGFMLVVNDKKGWILAVICTALYTVTFFKSSQSSSQGKDQPYFQYFKSYSVMALLFLGTLILLMQKPFFKKYHPTLKNWLWMIIIIIILVTDKFIF